MPASDPVLERIAIHPLPRGGMQARRARGGCTLTSRAGETGKVEDSSLPLTEEEPGDVQVRATSNDEPHGGGIAPLASVAGA